MRPTPVLLLATLATLATLAGRAAAQTPGATVRGVVHDSVARAPLAGALVQLVGAGGGGFVRTAHSDSAGRYAIADVPDGRYQLGFLHPMLDSLGLEPTLREVRVAGGAAVQADLAIPSPARLRAAICGADAARDSSGVVVGVVRDARDGTAAGARVSAEWLELTLSRQGIAPRTASVAVTTAENGWFALCGVPRPGTMALLAARGADSTARVEVEVADAGLLRRDLYLGPATAGAAGGVRLTGTVVAAVGEGPLDGARVGIVGGPQTRTNERGEWTLADAPPGTRTLEVRAVGYYPERRPVHAIPDAPPVRVALPTLKSVLDTVRVLATRGDRFLSGFEDRRRRTGAGRFLTAVDIARLRPVNAADVFRNVPGIRVYGDSIVMRGVFEEECTPAFYVNGHHMRGLEAADINLMMNPSQVVGIEVYAVGSAVPPQFQPGLGGCGSIVIWTR